MSFKKFPIAIYLLPIFFLASASSADALCGRYGEDQMDDFLGADIVVIGQASGVTERPSEYAFTMQDAKFKITESLKGNARGTIPVFQSECDGHLLKEGSEFILFAVKNKDGGYDAQQAAPKTGDCYYEPREDRKSCENKLVELRAIAQFYKDVIVAKRDGTFETHFDNGQVKVERNFKKGSFNGDYRAFYPDGQIRSQMHYEGGNREGESRHYYENGALWEVCSYKGGYRDGVCKGFDQETGQTAWEETYQMGEKAGSVGYIKGKIKQKSVVNSSGSYDFYMYDENGNVTQAYPNSPRPKRLKKNL